MRNLHIAVTFAVLANRYLHGTPYGLLGIYVPNRLSLQACSPDHI